MTVHALIALAVVFGWFVVDARGRGYKASFALKLAMPTITIVALPYYLLRSRGLRGGARALLLLALAFAGTMIAYHVGSWLA